MFLTKTEEESLWLWIDYEREKRGLFQR